MIWKDDKRKQASMTVHNAAAKALGEFAEGLLTMANSKVPIEEGTLERSGDTDLDRKALKATISYDTPYAVRQHEDTRLRHDAGREAKWLEHTLKSNSSKLGPFVADRIKRVS